ncbi:MAG: hypothetical protein IPL25_19215 [Saprospiraceae bacterium]|nr:hypothetical protein [Candidatus Vicinibacter affinis]
MKSGLACRYADKLKSKKQLIGYVFKFKETYFTELSKAETWINPQTGILEELVLYYNQNHNIAASYHQPTYVRPRLHIVYTTRYPKANIFKKISYDKYIIITNGKVRPKPVCKDWDIHILTQKI